MSVDEEVQTDKYTMFAKLKLLRLFAQEIFGEEKYYPVFHGETNTTKPLALLVKRRRCIWKRPFARTEFVILDGLEKYMEKDQVQKFLETVKSKVTREDLTELKNVNQPAYSHQEGHFGVGEEIEGTFKSSDYLGSLELGKVSREHITDPDLREILVHTALDYDKVNCFEDSKLLLITSVVYSEKFEVHGYIGHQEEVGAQMNLQFPTLQSLPLVLKLKIAARYKKEFTPPGMSARCVPGPILIKCCRVQFNWESGKLEIPKGEFVGKAFAIPRGGMNGEDDEEWDDVVTNLDTDETDLPEYFTPGDIEKLELINREVLMAENSREQRKARVRRYRRWFEQALTKKNQKDQKVLLTNEEPLAKKDCKFLSGINVFASPDQSILDLTTLTKEIIQGYGIVLKTLEDLPDEEWTKLEKTFADGSN